MAHDFKLSVNAIIVKNKEILLVKRADRDMWRLPGGYLNIGETIDEAVIRLVKEKMGLDISIQRVLGLYSKPIDNELVVAFVCELARKTKPKIGGDLVAAKFFSLDKLPDNFPEKNQERLDDYNKNAQETVVRTQMSAPSSLRFDQLNNNR